VLANASFVVASASSSAEEALRRLGGLRYAIVVEASSDDPMFLCTAADLRLVVASRLTLAQCALPPAVVAPADVSVGELAASDAVTLLGFNPHGVVVRDGDEIVGVLEHRVVDHYLATAASLPGETRGPSSGLPGDAVLGGAVQVATAQVVCERAGCGYVNRLAYYDPRHPPLCQNEAGPEHVLRIARM
jgi:hypothetical protein